MTCMTPLVVAGQALSSLPRADRAAAVAALMRANPGAAYPLDRLAAATGLSRYQFLRAFRGALGTTPHAYLLAQRVARAKRLLSDGDAVAEVAAALGFADQAHLTTAFRRQVGITPAHFARRAARRRAGHS